MEQPMKYTSLGSTGLIVSRLAFGAMTFTAGNKDIGSIYKVGAKLAHELVGRSLDAGVNVFDTADGYANGESETLLGAALKPHRERVIIATKVGFRTGVAAADLILTDAQIAQLDAAIPLPSVYPNWFIDNLADQAVAQALQR